jgi:hypothetical protein
VVPDEVYARVALMQRPGVGSMIVCIYESNQNTLYEKNIKKTYIIFKRV